jgi:hypothetical protein
MITVSVAPHIGAGWVDALEICHNLKPGECIEVRVDSIDLGS